MQQFSINLYFEILSLLFAVIFYLNNRNNKLLSYFVPFLFLTVVVELIGWRWGSNADFVRRIRYGMYNIFTTVEFIFYTSLFYTHFKIKNLKRFTLFFIPLYIILVLINFLFIQGFNRTFHSYTFLIGSFFIVIFCCCSFYEAVLPDKIDDQLSKQPFFWICSGLLIYYLGSVIINALFDYLTSNDLRIEGIRIYGIINNSLNVILYSSFCIAFFLCRDNKKISS